MIGTKVARLKAAPSKEETKKTIDGEKRSEIVNKAKNKVPTIKPNWTAEVKSARDSFPKLKYMAKSVKIPLVANQMEAQQNWEKIIIGRIRPFIR